MELSERCIQTLEKEGFSVISEQVGLPAAAQYFPVLSAPAALLVTDGSCTVTVHDTVRTLHVGERIDIPASVSYAITAGPVGYQLIFGEK